MSTHARKLSLHVIDHRANSVDHAPKVTRRYVEFPTPIPQLERSIDIDSGVVRWAMHHLSVAISPSVYRAAPDTPAIAARYLPARLCPPDGEAD
jgi:hypothetical protein